jgi:hypothetical protein
MLTWVVHTEGGVVHPLQVAVHGVVVPAIGHALHVRVAKNSIKRILQVDHVRVREQYAAADLYKVPALLGTFGRV